MLSDADEEVIREHYELKRKRCTRRSHKLRPNMIRFANGLGATTNEIKKILDDIGLPTTDEEIEKLLKDAK